MENEMTKVYPRGTTNPMFTKITKLVETQGIQSKDDPCIKKLQEILTMKFSDKNICNCSQKDCVISKILNLNYGKK